MSRAFWTSLTFLAVYLLAFGAFVLSGFDHALAEIAARAAALVLWHITGVDVATAAIDGMLWIQVPRIAATQVNASLVIIYFPLFIAVVSVASIRRRGMLFWSTLAFGAIVIFGLETLALSARIWAYGATVLGGGIVFQLFQFLLYLSDRGLAAIPSFVAALVLWSQPRDSQEISLKS